MNAAAIFVIVFINMHTGAVQNYDYTLKFAEQESCENTLVELKEQPVNAKRRMFCVSTAQLKAGLR